MPTTPPKKTKKSKEIENSLEILHNPDEMYFNVPVLASGAKITPKNIEISKEFFKGFFGNINNIQREIHWALSYQKYIKLLRNQYNNLLELYDILLPLHGKQTKYFSTQKISLTLLPEWNLDCWQWILTITDTQKNLKISFDEKERTLRSICNLLKEKNPLKMSFFIFQRFFFQSFESFLGFSEDFVNKYGRDKGK